MALSSRRVVRARQRDRATSLPGFDRTFAPQAHEWAIDKLQLKIPGRWRTDLSSGQEFFAQRLSDNSLTWLRRPEQRGNTISIESAQPSPLTLSQLKILATGCNGNNGGVIVDLAVNPTRTLSSLIVRFGEREDFRAQIFATDELTFFGLRDGHARLPPSLDGGDNYLPEHPSARSLLGRDPFATFMPIYLAQMQALLSRVMSEHHRAVVLDGVEQVVSSPDGYIRLDWGNAAVPQIETYFERFHRNAVGAVRGAATSILDADTSNRVTLYPAYEEQPGLERSADRIALTATVNLTVDSRHVLSVYAKTPSRIRFEMRRVRRGRYSARTGSSASAPPTPLARLLHILLEVERRDASRLIRWDDLFGFFDEPDAVGIGELAYFMGAIFHAANGSSELFTLLTERLMVDGGLVVGVDDRINRAAVVHLERAGVIEKGRIRHRHAPSQIARYRLVSIYRSLRERMLTSLARHEDQA